MQLHGKIKVNNLTAMYGSQISKYHLEWLGKGIKKSIKSPIVDHPLDTEHNGDIPKSLNVFEKVPRNPTQGLKCWQLCTAKAIESNRETIFMCPEENIAITCYHDPILGETFV